MNYIDFSLKTEEKLRKRMKIRRIITGALIISFLILLVVFWLLYRNSRTVEVIDYGFIDKEKVSYNTDYIFGIAFAFCAFMASVGTLISDLIFSRLVTVEMNSSYITYYRGIIHTQLYINGEYRDGLSFDRYFRSYLEGTLPDLTKVTVSLGKWYAHMSFSNGRSFDI